MEPHTINDIKEFVGRIQKEIEEFSDSQFERDMIRLVVALEDIEGTVKCRVATETLATDTIQMMQTTVVDAMPILIGDMCTMATATRGCSCKVGEICLADGRDAEIQLSLWRLTKKTG